ncbi:hypothetical protein, partial [Thiolapillus sp.]
RAEGRVIPCRGAATMSTGVLVVAEPIEIQKDRDVRQKPALCCASFNGITIACEARRVLASV